MPFGYTSAMGLLSLFRKGKPDVVADDDDAWARLAANSELLRQRAQAELDAQRDAARATVLKIDAIEAAMTADIFNEPEPAFRRPLRPAVVAPLPHDGATVPLLDEAVTELLDEDDIPAEAAAAESAPLVEEVAILYANGDTATARLLLADAVAAHAPGSADRTAWWMLFDLHHASGDQQAFDDLAIDYLGTFETSPPSWRPAIADAPGGVVPTAALSGVLDGASAAQIGRIGAAAEGVDGRAPMLRLDFSRVAAVEPEGCALLHDALRSVQRDRELVLAGAEELLAQVAALLDVGRRDGGPAPWLLRLELLRLLDREKDFDEAAMDYCITFEVSPPSFTPPGRVAHAPKEASAPAIDRYLLPAVVAGETAGLAAGLRAYAEHRPALVLDCSRLLRIEPGAAGQLLAALQDLAGNGRRVELRELNHLVAALLRLLGYGSVVRLLPHRY